MRAAAIIPVLIGGAVQAEEADVVTLNATYLAEPTEWCAADEGVPYVLSVDGPDLHASAFAEAPKTSVRVRRGGETTEDVDISRIDPSEIRTRRGNEARTVGTVNGPRVDELKPVGRLQARLSVCDTPWGPVSVAGTWAVVASDGTVASSGETDKRSVGAGHPLFHLWQDFPQAVRVGGQTFAVMRAPKYTRTTEAFASPAEERNQ